MRLLLLSCLMLVSLLGCHRQPTDIPSSHRTPTPPGDCQTVRHLGGKTQICGQPQRIVVLNPKMLDILLSLDVQPIGYAEIFTNRHGDFDQPSQQIPYLGDRITQPIANLGMSSKPSLETIIRLKPDLILGDIRGNQQQYTQLSRIAPTLLFEYVGRDKWQDSLQAIAQVLGRSNQAKKIIAAHRQQIATTRQALASVVKAYPKVLMVSSQQLNSSINLVTPLDFCGSLLEDIGFKLATVSHSEPKNITQPISVEILPQLNADLIIVQGHNIVELGRIKNTNSFAETQLQSVKNSWKTNTLAQSLTASRNNRVYFIPTYICLGLPSPSGTQITLQSLQDQLSPLAKTVNQN
ncbi:iron-siderophore ABC transporter substrate-binding protein [Cronbergia sp. UHCC 0137]|uniref:iron-siderophore ABC transporter substrate-binding protein n=1 Tax=Cronbergia sp. UHCC 0137 TaxID=3110239 RepID=UPI002B219BD0|nr:iron-siderophore ABC transporter substrate-binding protein [Cronbergia sp. UHCC 0137]MEA5620084.1 iron-siderophore ABC transporter substrate-binding protein [Cronbergia sp. UHCC 0137]